LARPKNSPRGQVGRVVATSHTAMSYSGPLPTAAQLRQYEEILPGLADRIVAMAERNAAHRQSLEATVVKGNTNAQRRGQWFAFVLAFGIVCVGAWLVYVGRTSVGLWLIMADVLALAAVFLGGRWLAKKEREKRRQDMIGALTGQP